MYSSTVVIPSTKNLRSGPGPDPVRHQGPVHSPPGPGPTELGPVHPLTGPDTQTYGVGPVWTQVHEGQDWAPDNLPLHETADSTTMGGTSKPVVFQRCHASFESRTQLFTMQDRNHGDRPDKHVCAGCCRYYIRKFETTKHTFWVMVSDHYIFLPSWLNTYTSDFRPWVQTIQPADCYSKSRKSDDRYPEGSCGGWETRSWYGSSCYFLQGINQSWKRYI